MQKDNIKHNRTYAGRCDLLKDILPKSKNRLNIPFAVTSQIEMDLILA